MIPEEIKEKWKAKELAVAPEVNLARQARRIAAMAEKAENAQASELLKEILALYERVRLSEKDYTYSSYPAATLAEQFQMEEEQIKERLAGISEEQRYLFAEKGEAGPRVWYPLLEMLALVWQRREELSDGELSELYEKSRSCIAGAGGLQGVLTKQDYRWDVSPLSEDALELALQSMDDEKERWSLYTVNRDGKSACALELYGRTGREEYILGRLRELIGLDRFLQDGGAKSNKETRKDVAKSAAAFLAALEGASGDWTALREQMEEFWQEGYRLRWEKAALKERSRA